MIVWLFGWLVLPRGWTRVFGQRRHADLHRLTQPTAWVDLGLVPRPSHYGG